MAITLAASHHGLLPVSFRCWPTTFCAVVWTASEAWLRTEIGERTLAASLYGFMPFYIPETSRPVKKSLRFFYGFLTSLHWKLRFFLRFPTVFFPPRQESTREMYTGKHRNRRRMQCFVTVNPVFVDFTRRHYTEYLRQLRYKFNAVGKIPWKNAEKTQFSLRKREKTV
jgi:hypothetical protein